MTDNKTVTAPPRALRDKVSEILAKNHIRTDQIAIDELAELVQVSATRSYELGVRHGRGNYEQN